MSSVVSKEHLAKANALRLLLATYARSEDLIRIGAYQKGSDPVLDDAVRNLPALQEFLQQKPDHVCGFDFAVNALLALSS